MRPVERLVDFIELLLFQLILYGNICMLRQKEEAAHLIELLGQIMPQNMFL